MKPRFFESRSDFRLWLEKNHQSTDVLWVGFFKKTAGRKSVTYPEALDEALCFGWIDGIRKSLGDQSYTIRFTPRKAMSNWSLVNVSHVQRLKKVGLMRPAGLAAFAKRDVKRTGVYSFETAQRELSAAYEKQFRANRKAWQFFEKQPPSFRKTAAFWVMSAKKEETQLRRLRQLILSSEEGVRLGVITGKSAG
jgi:uncharacterized protein YdeI (YjbR/CyaY-like superfamily)